MSKKIIKNNEIPDLNLLSELNGKPSQLYNAATHIIKNGGKRIRPYLVLKCCEILNGNKKYAMYAANSIEMIHNFTLIHDDIIDNDDIRHGVTTVHKKFGIPMAILAGDILFSKAYKIISDSSIPLNISIRLISKLARSCIELCEGQTMDIKMANNKKTPSQNQYIKMIEKKTASLFAASCSMGAICSQAKDKDIKKFALFGLNLGIAFQIIDDFIGIFGDPKITKKPVGNDLREGKKSLPIIIAINSATEKQRKKIMNAFGNTNISKKDLNDALNTINTMKIKKIIRNHALYYSNTAKQIINEYQGETKKEIISILDFIVKRVL